VTEIFGFDDGPRIDLEAEASRALEEIRDTPGGDRLAEMLPDLLLIGASYVSDLWKLAGRYRRLAAEMRLRQAEREHPRYVTLPGSQHAIAAPVPPEKRETKWTTLQHR
jgi:hypothetical protein